MTDESTPPLSLRIVSALTSRHYRVRGDSMKPDFDAGQLLLVSYAAYSATSPFRGDVVVMRDPRGTGKHYLKRLVSMPGETVSFIDGVLLIDGRPLGEPYLGGLPAILGLDRHEWTLGPGEYFAMGDNRSHSTDSSDYGPLSAEDIIGKAWFRYWPIGKFGVVRGGSPPSQPSPDWGKG